MPLMIKIIIAGVFLIFGITIVLSIPSEYEGPLLIALAEGHDFNLTDAVGVITTLLPWGYYLYEWLRERRKERKEQAPQIEEYK